MKKAIIIFMIILPMVLAGCNTTINKSNENNQKEPIATNNYDKDSNYVPEKNDTSNGINNSDSGANVHENNELEANLADNNTTNNNDNPFICIADMLNERDINKVEDAYSALLETHSEADMDELATYVGECYRVATDKLIKDNKELEKNINELRTHLNNIINDVFIIENGINGGGTMYSHSLHRRLGWKEFRLYWYSKDILNQSEENKNRYDNVIVDIQNSFKQIDEIDVNELNDKNDVIASSDHLKNEINSIINILNVKNDANSELLELINSYITLQ